MVETVRIVLFILLNMFSILTGLRIDCHNDGIHAGIMNGISGNKNEGAFSVALSGGYEDDKDNGNVL
jgi:hypothetical protein